MRRITSDDALIWKSAVEKVLLLEDGQGSPVSIDDAADVLSDSRCYLIITENESGVVVLLSACRIPNVTSDGEIVYLDDFEGQEQARNRGFGHSMIDALLCNCRFYGVTTVCAG
jgi:hypothetical protein